MANLIVKAEWKDGHPIEDDVLFEITERITKELEWADDIIIRVIPLAEYFQQVLKENGIE